MFRIIPIGMHIGISVHICSPTQLYMCYILYKCKTFFG